MKMHISRNLIIGELQEISVIKMNSRIWSLIVAMVLGMSTFAASVETDRNWYLAGEAMKVRMTADDAMIAYAELCDLSLSSIPFARVWTMISNGCRSRLLTP